jgi:aerobic-type carbon monoxide dehydrogenase small subunit (CoxS/CutS family)
MATTLTINGEQNSFDTPADMPLLWVLRDVLGMTGTKFGCGGACTVHIDGKPERSCMLPVGAMRDRARGIQYAAASRFHHQHLWNTGSPECAGDDD